MAEPKLEIEKRMDKVEAAVRTLAKATKDQGLILEIEDILDGTRTKTTSEDSTSSAD